MYSDDKITTERARLEKYSETVMEREKKLHELKSKIDELIQQIAEPPHDEGDIPEIRDSMDGDVSAATRQNKPCEKWMLAFGIAVVIAVFGYFLTTAPVKARGELAPKTRIVVRAPLDGFLSEVNYTEGHQIEKGSSLGRFQVAAFDENTLLRKGEELDLIADQIQHSELRTARLKNLIDKIGPMVNAGAVTVIQLEDILGNYELALQQRDELKREFLTTQEDASRIRGGLEQCSLIAPITGIVVTRGLRNLNHGFYEKGDQIAELIDPTVMVAQVLVTEKYVKRLRVGQRAKVRWATSSGWQVGRVAKVGEYSGKPMLTLHDLLVEDRSVKKKGVMVQIELDEQNGTMKYGMDVEARIATRR